MGFATRALVDRQVAPTHAEPTDGLANEARPSFVRAVAQRPQLIDAR
ncbi:MAG: hypothetical protein MUF54_08005 [Polyangiaceae bacterium]|nr:hypothetical protein [Polyangiaceae bacterium]